MERNHVMEPSEFTLNVRLVKAGPAIVGADSEDCTSDGCGDTPGSVGIADC
jgi:FxLD family lantipeptide